MFLDLFSPLSTTGKLLFKIFHCSRFGFGVFSLTYNLQRDGGSGHSPGMGKTICCSLTSGEIAVCTLSNCTAASGDAGSV